jgi:hypothetical protein
MHATSLAIKSWIAGTFCFQFPLPLGWEEAFSMNPMAFFLPFYSVWSRLEGTNTKLLHMKFGTPVHGVI